ncbi:hypothetical protein [Sphingobacterium sp.]|uniref:hypothetical protein n=1 Tax=Sphingobacterium sp. TaxID=341027 RepID=UPI0031D737AC
MTVKAYDSGVKALHKLVVKQRYIWPITEQQVIGPPQHQILLHNIRAGSLQVGKYRGHGRSLNQIPRLPRSKSSCVALFLKILLKEKQKKESNEIVRSKRRRKKYLV